MKSLDLIPRLQQPLFETHCHLDYLAADQLEVVLARAADLGVDRLMTIAVSPENLSIVRDLAAKYPQVYASQGIHPHEAEHCTPEVLAEIDQHLGLEKIRAVGEIGLDYYYDHADRAVQRRVFAQQLALAVEHALPVVIHSRDADADMMAMLAEYRPQMIACPGVIHSFTSGQDLADLALSMGFMLGFNGIVTFNKADNVRSVLAQTPVEQLVIETDSPYLTPAPFRGQTNAPYFIPLIADYVAQQKQMSCDQILPILYANSLRLFGWP